MKAITVIFVLILPCLLFSNMIVAFSVDLDNNAFHEYKKNVDMVSTEEIVDSGMWLFETIDMSGDVGFYSSIAVDSDDMPSIAYYDRQYTNLNVISKKDENWVRYTVDDSGDVGRYASLAFDNQGCMHIAYYDASFNDLKYARQMEDGWDIQTLDSKGVVGLDCSLALDKDDHPHISFFDDTNQVLKYITFYDDQWATEIVDDTIGSGHGSSIALSDSGGVFISYSNSNDEYLYCASRIGSGWSVDCVDDKSSVFASTAIDTDSFGNPHICYFDVPSTTDDWSLKYATCINGVWSLEIIDPEVQYFWNDWGCSICVDQFDRLHIGYYKWMNWDLQYALNDGNGWIIESVDTDGSVGAFADIDVTSTGYPQISYVDLNNMALKHAVKVQFAPQRPIPPVGQNIGFKGTVYEYRIVSSDFDGDQIRYYIDWGDDSPFEITELYPSDVEVVVSHSWGSTGSYSIRLKAFDSNGFESPWSEPKSVVMPKCFLDVLWYPLNFLRGSPLYSTFLFL